MDDIQARSSGHDFSETGMRWAYEGLYQLRQHVISIESATEYLRLHREMVQLESAWLTGPPKWALRWRFLDAAVQDWANDPDFARQLRDEAFYGSFFAPPNLDGIERESLAQAAELVHCGALGELTETSSLAYIATYTYTHTASATGDLGAHTSWWKAREWVRERAVTDSDTAVDMTVAAHDVVSGKRHLLNTATAIPATELVTELDRLAAVLGGARERDGKPFVDDLHYDVLCDDYRASMIAARHPRTGIRRFEHKLYTDDLRDQTLDFAAGIGRQGTVEELAGIDRTARQDGADLAAVGSSWLDQIAEHAERARERLFAQGIEVHYPHAHDPTLLIQAGHSPVDDVDPWYGWQLRLTQLGDEHTGELHQIGRYRSCEELLTALQNRTSTTGPAYDATPDVVPAEVATMLREFGRQLRELDTNVATSATLRTAIRSGQPIHWTRNGKQSNTTGFTAPGERDPAHKLIETPARESQCRSTGQERAQPPPSESNPIRDAARKRRERTARQPNRTRPRRRHL
ncbi:hypothetical protein F3087_45005 [Nocardia colli]|uniref:Uncharacterized protein n=1 Tax=Nocardia colli TaxID=2545717 RepID=A0A5N0DML5_9NOCA|nr:hypothetical protein [Nocardia colli]KAA8877335.1 hypothetical protein F3087_45005 [Nocardia colli]